MTTDRVCDDRGEPSPETLSHLAPILSLLGDETRLRIVLALAREGELGVSSLVERAGKSRSAVTYYLARMRLAGLLGYRSEGPEHFYRLEWGMLRDVLGRFFAEAAGRGKELHLGDCSLGYRADSRGKATG
jgi:DNA-binding transcriptional ArsR family regulator